MSTADWAFVVSLCSLLLSVGGFVWSVWSKFIFPKPKVEVHFSVMSVIGPGWENAPEAVCLSATNHGPAEVTLHSAIARPKRKGLRRKFASYGLLNPYSSYPYDLTTKGPFSGGLPKKIAVGEQFSVYFPLVRDWFEVDKLADFGVHDTFGRDHWASRRSVHDVRKAVLERGLTHQQYEELEGRGG